jgi:hypothetical protein
MANRAYEAKPEDVPMIMALLDGRLDYVVLWEQLPRQPEMPFAEGWVGPTNKGADSIEQITISSSWYSMPPRSKGERIEVKDTFGTPLGTVKVSQLYRPEKRNRYWGLVFEVVRGP